MAKFNEYPAKTTPKDADKFMLYSAEDAANKLIDYDKLADAVLNKLTSKTFGLDQGNMTLLAALNQLNSKAQINAGIMNGSIVIPIKKLQSMVLFCTGDNNATSFIAIRFDAKGVQGTALLFGYDRKLSYTYADNQLTISAQDTSYYGRYIAIS